MLAQALADGSDEAEEALEVGKAMVYLCRSKQEDSCISKNIVKYSVGKHDNRDVDARAPGVRGYHVAGTS